MYNQKIVSIVFMETNFFSNGIFSRVTLFTDRTGSTGQHYRQKPKANSFTDISSVVDHF